MNIDNAIEEFKNYTKDYLKYDTMMSLKVNHTLRVVSLCEMIAKSLNLNDEETYIAKIIGLLHDIGRFEQWKNYKTFVDKKSIDHADYGVKLLKENNWIRKFIEIDTCDELILNSIKYHNKYSVPEELDDKTKLYAKLIRDADKIDILYLYILGELSVELDENAFSESIYNSLINHESIDRIEVKSKTDRLGVSLGFIFDINYKESFKILKETDYMNKIIDMYKEKTNNEVLKKQFEEIKKTINDYIEVNLC